ncbi:aminoglycoside 6'-N-acetyltransferase I [Evansella vedderi]|uniref:Aminoglycoside 6'-N-acetyltransferase I n=1 Tax=Evansella vedderi TaxID=38282 RepID=A0ABT9ZWM4_9BACI|nr:GNAT family N-acetyltransferase [Evansella vedderi]MDQ0255147.1 aminoglycoside 6'-N-acetyltransferase I [Evansella vedderi]
MKIIDLTTSDEQYIYQTAEILVDGFKENWPEAWPTLESALEEVQDSISNDKISRIALDPETDHVLGWIGAISERRGKVWELHPLVVRKDKQKTGIGKALVLDLERQAKVRGGLTIWLGTDDENFMTTISGKDLYPNLLENLQNIQNIKGHPYEFYLKLGFSLSGVLPDANGPGKPDIFMSKKIY